MESQLELLPAEEPFPPRCRRFLRSGRVPALAARAQVTAGLAGCFLPAGARLGVNAVVNASRLLGVRFDNWSRAGIGAAAGLPPHLAPDPAEVRAAMQRFARSLLKPWRRGGEYLQSLADGGAE